MRDTQVWQCDDGSIVRREAAGRLLQYSLNDNAYAVVHDTLPADAVPLVRADEAQQVADWLSAEVHGTPDATNPDHLSSWADGIETYNANHNDLTNYWIDISEWMVKVFRAEADRLEHEQSEAEATEQLAHVVADVFRESVANLLTNLGVQPDQPDIDYLAAARDAVAALRESEAQA